MLLEAGAEMAASGGNWKALSFFGLEWMTKNEWRGSLGKLESFGLPVFTSPDRSELLEGDRLISDLFHRADHCPPRRLILAADRTYLHACTQLCTTTRGHVILGGAHRCPGFDAADESQVVLKSPDGTVTTQTITRDTEKATEIEALVIWDAWMC